MKETIFGLSVIGYLACLGYFGYEMWRLIFLLVPRLLTPLELHYFWGAFWGISFVFFFRGVCVVGAK